MYSIHKCQKWPLAIEVHKNQLVIYYDTIKGLIITQQIYIWHVVTSFPTLIWGISSTFQHVFTKVNNSTYCTFQWLVCINILFFWWKKHHTTFYLLTKKNEYKKLYIRYLCKLQKNNSFIEFSTLYKLNLHLKAAVNVIVNWYWLV